MEKHKNVLSLNIEIGGEGPTAIKQKETLLLKGVVGKTRQKNYSSCFMYSSHEGRAPITKAWERQEYCKRLAAETPAAKPGRGRVHEDPAPGNKDWKRLGQEGRALSSKARRLKPPQQQRL